MSTLNKRNINTRKTHEGAPAHSINKYQELRRTVLACMLWEDNFYEDGVSIAERITTLVHQVNLPQVIELAKEARGKYKLRHTPLLIMVATLNHPLREYTSQKVRVRAINDVILRADDMTEILSIYWKDGKKPLPTVLRKGLKKAFGKFNSYQLAKYDRKKNVMLKDVIRLVHPVPKDNIQSAIWKNLIDGTLVAPDTWEVALSGGADKRETFERLMRENKLGYMALLRNLRNMYQAGVNKNLVAEKLYIGASKSMALPFRFIAAARACPQWENIIDASMQESLGNQSKLPGKTVLLIDKSGSMENNLSGKSDLTRFDAACALAILLRGICEDIDIWTFSSFHYNSDIVKHVPPRKGMALADAIDASQKFGGTQLIEALDKVDNGQYDRLIVITDEQAFASTRYYSKSVPAPLGNGYMINVASYKNGVGYGKWKHIDGFSEAVISWIQELESTNLM